MYLDPDTWKFALRVNSNIFKKVSLYLLIIYIYILYLIIEILNHKKYLKKFQSFRIYHYFHKFENFFFLKIFKLLFLYNDIIYYINVILFQKKTIEDFKLGL
jgi:hypothetical protein